MNSTITHRAAVAVSRPPAAAGTSPSRFARLGNAVWAALSTVGCSRGRAALLAMAREHEASRPEFAARLREAARRDWL